MTWGNVAGAAVGLVGGMLLKPSSGGAGGGSGASGAQQNVDPFSPYRGQYGKQLNELMKDPGSVTSQPGFQSSLDTGTTNLERSNAAAGRTSSGAEQAGIAKLGQDTQSSWFDQQFKRLSSLSGASAGPGAGGEAANQYNQAQDKASGQQAGAIGNLAGQAIGAGIKAWGSPSAGDAGTGTGGSGVVVGGEQGSMLNNQWGAS
jgi:hypothetical protein